MNSGQERVFHAINSVSDDEIDHASTVHLAANENLISNTARRFLSSPLCCRHHEGGLETRKLSGRSADQNRFVFRALNGVYELEKIAIESLNRQMESIEVDLRLSSGMHAMISTILCATELEDLVLSIAPQDGGHFATRFVLLRSGRRSSYIPWDSDGIELNFVGLRDLCSESKVSAVYLDQGTPLYRIDLGKIREIIGPEALLVYDASHTLGLIAGRQFQSPLLEGADILQGNTHKTYPGPQKALIAFQNRDFASRYRARMSDGIVSNQHTHHLLALFVAVLEMDEFGMEFAAQMVRNASSLFDHLRRRGHLLVARKSEPPCTHQVLIASDDSDRNVLDAHFLNNVGISTNSRIAFRRPVIRIGLQEVTRRGMMENEMEELGDIISVALRRDADQPKLRDRTWNLMSKFQTCRYSFDESPFIRR
jgi:glycine/serine hydroxymethyltransferase